MRGRIAHGPNEDTTEHATQITPVHVRIQQGKQPAGPRPRRAQLSDAIRTTCKSGRHYRDNELGSGRLATNVCAQVLATRHTRVDS